MTPLRRILDMMTTRGRWQLFLLVLAVVLMALLQAGAVMSLGPFLGLLSNPAMLDRSRALAWLREASGIAGNDAFLFFFGVVVFIVLIVGNGYSALVTWTLLRFAWMHNHTLSVRLLEAYLGRPYEFFIRENTSTMGEHLLVEVRQVVSGVIIQGLQVFSRGMICVCMLGVLLVTDPLMALAATVLFGGMYGGLFVCIRKRVAREGHECVAFEVCRFKVASEALCGVKEVKLLGVERLLVQEYSRPSLMFARSMARNAALQQIPRYVFEMVAFGGVIVIVLSLLAGGQQFGNILPVLGVYAFATYRLLPALHTVFAGMTSIRFHLAAIDALHQHMADAPPLPRGQRDALPFQRCVDVRMLSFRYESAERETLHNISLTIGASEWVALVGSTGSGKTTLADLILGLLTPTDGEVLVDGTPLSGEVVPTWQRAAGYVPQNIFLVDDTVERNICFGVPEDQLDRSALERAARIAQLHDFVVSELPQSYGTVIGERGVRLSGGQRQRIGIARALYRAPRLLVLDEATSALDSVTERAFFDALRKDLRETTVISIAHRLSTTRDFDRIYVMKVGRVVDVGTYQELSTRSREFVLLGGGAEGGSPSENGAESVQKADIEQP
jgi:ABC-type multidrug transport system fused ATPase/permease subunit